MFAIKKIHLLFLVVSILLSACDKDNPVETDSIKTKANVTGSVSLYDEYGNKVTNERMMVYLESSTGLSFVGESQKDGSYVVANVAYADNYSIRFEKSGYGTFKMFGFDHVYTGSTGSIEGPVRLSAKSSTYCTSLVTVQKTDTVEFHMVLEGGDAGESRKIRLLFHTISLLNNEIFSNYTPKLTISGNNQIVVFTKQQLAEYGLVSGTIYFVQVYGDSYYSNSYYDEVSQRFVLPNLGFKTGQSVPTGSFTMP